MFFLFFAVLLAAVLAAGAGFYYACTVPSSKIFKPVVVRGPAEGRRISLSFDDGPAPPFTEQILDILREKKVPATFFVCGENVERHPEILRRVASDGHMLGNHTYSHPFLYFRSQEAMADEIDRTQEAIEKVAGVRPAVFRPPYGGRWLGLMEVLGKRGMKLIMWSATGYDWKCRGEAITRLTLKELHPGAVILLHDGHEVCQPGEFDRLDTVKALPAIIDQARKAGYTFAPLSEFL